LREKIIVKKRVFVSFDFYNDRQLKEFIIGQSKLSDCKYSETLSISPSPSGRRLG